MVISGKLFPGQTKEEKVFMLLRRHWLNYWIFGFLTLLSVIVLGVVVALWFLYSQNNYNPNINVATIVFLSTFLLAILAGQLYGFVDYYLDVYIITNRRIVDISQDGFFRRKISELHMQQIQDVNAEVVGFFETLFHYGDVHIQTAGEQANFVFKSIPHPYTVAKKILDIHESHIENNKHGGTSNKPIPQNSPKQANQNYDDGCLTEIELEAKKIISDTPLLDRLKRQGIYVTDKHTSYNDLVSKKELEEGEEVKIL